LSLPIVDPQKEASMVSELRRFSSRQLTTRPVASLDFCTLNLELLKENFD